MRLFSGKVGVIASDVVKVLVSAGDIETDAPKEVERDVAAVLDGYVSTEREIHDRAKDQVESRGLSQGDVGRIRKMLSDQKGIKTGDETLDYLLDQVVEMLLHSTHVGEVFAADHEMRRKMAPIFKKHMAVDDELANEVRGQMKHVQEGTTKWEIEYQRILGDIKRRKGLSLPRRRRSASYMRSMTGFGVADAPLGAGRLTVEVRTVNHRYLDLRVRVPKDLADLGMFVEQLTRSRVTRGRCEVSVRVDATALAGNRLDLERAKMAFLGFQRLRDEIAPGAEVPLALLASIPDLFAGGVSEDTLDEARAAVSGALRGALDRLDATRDREGGALFADLSDRGALLLGLVEQMAERVPAMMETYCRKVRERVQTLLASAAVTIHDGRVEQEVVLFADKTDITEELTRLRIHLAALGELLAAEGTVGRRVDFLLQEVSREVNTVGSKAQDAGITRAVVEAKAELERMREQVQNVE